MTELAATTPTREAIAPGPGRWRDALRNLRGIGRDPIAFFGEQFAAHGDFVRIRFPGVMVYALNHPDLVRHVLQERQQIYVKGLDYEVMKPLLGEGLLTSNGAFWKRQRGLAQPAFHRQRIQGFADLMARQALDTAARWRKNPGPLDLHAEMMRLTLAVVGEALFGAELAKDSGSIAHALDGALALFSTRQRSLWGFVPEWVPLPSHRKFRRDKAALDQVVERIIAERRAHGNEGRTDLLSMLMEARAEDGSDAVMSDVQLRDECMTMVLAGHETTANLLTWTFLTLAREPKLASALRDEIDGALHGAPPKLEDLTKLSLVERTIKESLRLHPPAWAITRVLTEDDEMRGVRLPANSEVFFSQWFLHRHPDFWPEPEAFDPGRFTESEEKKRPRFAYFPFGGGPRQCIGNIFAQLEAQILLTVLLQHTRVEVDPAQPVLPDPSITLRPKGGLAATVGPREASA